MTGSNPSRRHRAARCATGPMVAFGTILHTSHMLGGLSTPETSSTRRPTSAPITRGMKPPGGLAPGTVMTMSSSSFVQTKRPLDNGASGSGDTGRRVAVPQRDLEELQADFRQLVDQGAGRSARRNLAQRVRCQSPASVQHFLQELLGECLSAGTCCHSKLIVTRLTKRNGFDVHTTFCAGMRRGGSPEQGGPTPLRRGKAVSCKQPMSGEMERGRRWKIFCEWADSTSCPPMLHWPAFDPQRWWRTSLMSRMFQASSKPRDHSRGPGRSLWMCSGGGLKREGRSAWQRKWCEGSCRTETRRAIWSGASQRWRH